MNLHIIFFRLNSGLVFNQNLFDFHDKLTIGSVEYVDISINYKKAPGENPSGTAKVSCVMKIW